VLVHALVAGRAAALDPEVAGGLDRPRGGLVARAAGCDVDLGAVLAGGATKVIQDDLVP